MLEEAVDVMRRLWTGEVVRHRGEHDDVDTARLVSPDADLVRLYRECGGTGPTHVGATVCWAADEAEARATVHRLWPHQAVPGEHMQVLTSPQHFAQISSVVTEDMAVDAVDTVGNRVEDFVEGLRPFVEAGFDEVSVSQIGDDQEGFLRAWETELGPALKDL